MITFKQLHNRLKSQGIWFAAGIENIDSPFEYINVQEFPLRSERIRPHGLILTTLASFESLEVILDHISWLMERKVYGIGISELLINEIPNEVIELCTQHQFPLLVIPGPVPYSEVYKAYHALLIEESNEISEKIENINMTLMNVVASDDSYEKSVELIINTMGKYLRTPIIYLNRQLGIEGAWHIRGYDTNEIKQSIVEKILRNDDAVNDHIESATIIIRIGTSNLEVILNSIANERDLYGYFIVGIEERFNVLEQSIIKHGKTALLLETVKKKSMEKYLKNETVLQMETILTSLKHDKLEIDLSPAIQMTSQIHLIELYQHQMMNSVFNYIHSQLNSYDSQSLVWIYEQKIVCLVFKPLPTNLFDKVLRKHSQIVWGISEFSPNNTPSEVIRKYKQALLSVKTGVNRRRGINEWNSLGLDRLLIGVAEDPLSNEEMKNLLKPLVDLEFRENSELLKTLSVYLTSFLNLKDSAEQLFIHRNTVKYRIRKIEEIYGGVDFANVDTYLLFLTAIKLHKLRE